MACCLFSAKPLPEPMLIKFQWNLNRNSSIFIQENAFEMSSAKWQPFVQVELSYGDYLQTNVEKVQEQHTASPVVIESTFSNTNIQVKLPSLLWKLIFYGVEFDSVLANTVMGASDEEY